MYSLVSHLFPVSMLVTSDVRNMIPPFIKERTKNYFGDHKKVVN